MITMRGITINIPKKDSPTVSNAMSIISSVIPDTTNICVNWHMALPIIPTNITFFGLNFNRNCLYTIVLTKNDNDPHIVNI